MCLANLAIEGGSAADAEPLLRQALPEFEAEKDADSQAEAHDGLARILLSQGKVADASLESDKAARLSPEERSLRASIAATRSRIDSRLGKVAEARQALAAALEETTRLQLAGSQFAIRLAQAEVEDRAGAKAAGTLREELRRDAQKAGYLLIAEKASRTPK